MTVHAANYNGYLDAADCGVIGGWAWDSTLPNTPIGVDIYDGSTLKRVAAGDYRSDLPPAGIGDGYPTQYLAEDAQLPGGIDWLAVLLFRRAHLDQHEQLDSERFRIGHVRRLHVDERRHAHIEDPSADRRKL